MKIISATEAKQHFGLYLDEAMTESVLIQKSGRPAIVMINVKEYERLSALEDFLLAQQIRAAEANGYMGVESSAKLLNTLLEKDA
jgi:prevent-host-death family protein